MYGCDEVSVVPESVERKLGISKVKFTSYAFPSRVRRQYTIFQEVVGDAAGVNILKTLYPIHGLISVRLDGVISKKT